MILQALQHAPITLYNGIRLARPWPPVRRSFPDKPLVPPYLLDPPDIIPIDVGRQLFVDDFLIAETSLVRTFHRAEYIAGNPVLRPTTEWEKRDTYAERTKTRSNPTAMVFSDGVFYDAQSRLFKMWYMGGYSQNTCYALSQDGIQWEKPSLDVMPASKPLWSCAGPFPASEKASVIIPENVPGWAVVFETRTQPCETALPSSCGRLVPWMPTTPPPGHSVSFE